MLLEGFKSSSLILEETCWPKEGPEKWLAVCARPEVAAQLFPNLPLAAGQRDAKSQSGHKESCDHISKKVFSNVGAAQNRQLWLCCRSQGGAILSPVDVRVQAK